MARKALTKAQHVEATRAILDALDEFFNEPGKPKKYGIQVFARDLKMKQTNYYASIDRASGTGMVEELLNRWKAAEGGKQ